MDSSMSTSGVSSRRQWIDVGSTAAEPARSAAERWRRLVQTMDRQSEQGPLDLNLPSYPRKWECLARLTSAHAADVLRCSQLFVEAGDKVAATGILLCQRYKRKKGWFKKGIEPIGNPALVGNPPSRIK